MEKLQAKFRGDRARNLHVKRALRQELIVCPFLSSTPQVVQDIINLIENNEIYITNDDIILDLGCGDGSVLIGLLKQKQIYCKCIGVEIDNILCKTAIRKISDENLNGYINIIEGDIINTELYNLNKGTIIFTFLVPSCQEIVSKLLKKQCKKGVYIIAYKFELPKIDGWIPLSISETNDVVKENTKTKLYLYMIE